ncbi:prepilin-type N-terminal cleavage/methylation domain-containing protein [Marinobacter sp. SS5-14b]|uniref:prepilin-type N-terminal cleavage/methylation domain-containing protein n=1 Tax=Marinobacter sp. SS5-14b TaxID=3050456 RepID=UPI0026E05F6D|nr:prepilin-type N-terminal cleavage/methylation domain-containing protein [Marinobacter sp. SS5-14b]
MKHYSSKHKQKGFTLIELVVVIAILAILAAFALPRFAQLSEQAHSSNVKATAGAMAAGVALARAQWVANGLKASTDSLDGFGDGDLNVSSRGWPVAYTGGYTGEADGSAAMDASRCEQVWAGVLQSNAPTITGAAPDYAVTGSGSVCTYAYQADGLAGTADEKNITYDASTGDIATTENQ